MMKTSEIGPGKFVISAIHIYRFSRWAYVRHIPLLPRLLDYIVRLVFGCWVPHRANLGKGVVLGYGGLGIVIHDDSVIGPRTHVDQGVTIGGNARAAGVAIIGSDVYIGAGAKILGPIIVGDGAIIGANAVVLQNIPPRSVAVGVPARIVKTNIDPQNFLHHKRQANE